MLTKNIARFLFFFSIVPIHGASFRAIPSSTLNSPTGSSLPQRMAVLNETPTALDNTPSTPTLQTIPLATLYQLFPEVEGFPEEEEEEEESANTISPDESPLAAECAPNSADPETNNSKAPRARRSLSNRHKEKQEKPKLPQAALVACHICDKKVRQGRNFGDHYKKAHKLKIAALKKRFPATYALHARMTSLRQFRNGVDYTRAGRELTCCHCGYIYRSSEYMALHISREHKQSPNPSAAPTYNYNNLFASPLLALPLPIPLMPAPTLSYPPVLNTMPNLFYPYFNPFFSNVPPTQQESLPHLDPEFVRYLLGDCNNTPGMP